MLYVVNRKENLETIDLNFMESDHSYLEDDSMYANIERKRKHMKVHTTCEWALLISAPRINPSQCQVIAMRYDDFYDIKELRRKTESNKLLMIKG